MFGLNGPTVRKFHSQMPMSVLMYYVLNTVLWLIKEEEDSVDDNLNYWLVLCILMCILGFKIAFLKNYIKKHNMTQRSVTKFC